jgi:glucose/arabinose dehydrogenase
VDVVALVLALVVWACGGSPESASGPGTQPDEGSEPVALQLTLVASGLESPVHATSPVGDPRLFVAEQAGVIRIVRAGNVLGVPFLDIRDRVRTGSERGLLSLAFHPGYASNGTFFVNYTAANGATRVERYSIMADGDVADPGSGHLILEVQQPFSNHNGGHILFGADGMLYVAMGDGGSGGDPQGHGQNRETMLGALLRLDVDGGDPYAIPPDNPYAGSASFRPEIWAWGLRNPWRIAFDRTRGLLYVADVGQDRIEEVDVVPAGEGGLNFGWAIMEGSECFGGGACEGQDLVLPVLEYDHSEGCSVTGGLVYRGSAIPEVRGHYFYSDHCQGWLRSFLYENGAATARRQWNVRAIGDVTSFGEDSDGELYVLSADGRLYRLQAS